MAIPVLDLKLAEDPNQRGLLLDQLRDSLFGTGFLYVRNHGVPDEVVDNLERRMLDLFNLPNSSKSKLSKINSPHFLGYSGFAEEITKGRQDLREQFDFATELPAFYNPDGSNVQTPTGKDFSAPYWRLYGPNLWPDEQELPGFREALQIYHDAVADLSYRFIRLIEEVFHIPAGAFDEISFGPASSTTAPPAPQHRMKLVKYHATHDSNPLQGVGPHKDSSGWLTFLHQVGVEKGLEVLNSSGEWVPADPIPGTFVVNFGNPFEAATDGAVRATVHRVRAPVHRDRYSIPFFLGLPLDLKLSAARACVPDSVRSRRPIEVSGELPSFRDDKWDILGDYVLRKWMGSHPDVALKWYGAETVKQYTE